MSETRRHLQGVVDRAAAAEEAAWVAVVAAKQAVSDALKAHGQARRAHEHATDRLREHDGD